MASRQSSRVVFHSALCAFTLASIRQLHNSWTSSITPNYFRAPFNIDSSDTPDTHANPKNRCIQSASNLSRHPLPFTDSFKQPLLIISSTDIWKSILVDSKNRFQLRGMLGWSAMRVDGTKTNREQWRKTEKKKKRKVRI